jgi:hypothetical protein
MFWDKSPRRPKLRLLIPYHREEGAGCSTAQKRLLMSLSVFVVAPMQSTRTNVLLF